MQAQDLFGPRRDPEFDDLIDHLSILKEDLIVGRIGQQGDPKIKKIPCFPVVETVILRFCSKNPGRSSRFTTQPSMYCQRSGIRHS